MSCDIHNGSNQGEEQFLPPPVLNARLDFVCSDEPHLLFSLFTQLS
jgi:hypothetical protein